MEFNKILSPLKIKNYRLYFLGQGISQSGTRMQLVAQSWLVLSITGSGFALGLLAAFQFLPIFLFGAWGGVITDRFPKRKILYCTQLISGALALILALLVIFGWIKVWMVYILALALGLINVINSPTEHTFVIEMVREKELPGAIALNAIETNFARVFGPAFAGFLIVYFSLGFCFLINALSYFAVVIALFMMDAKELYCAPLIKATKGKLWDGIKYIKSSLLMKDILFMSLIVGSLACEFAVSLPLLAQFTFNGNAGTYSILLSAMGVGSLIGGLFMAAHRKATFNVFVFVTFLFGLFILATAISPILLLAISLLVVVGFFHIYFSSLGNTILQLKSVPEMRGRVTAIWIVAYSGSVLIGGPIIGWVCQYAGPRWGLALGGLATLLAAGIGARNLNKKSVERVA
ncbi:MFS transporter [Patescibacteria group bacterium]|nr:MFS transporter [Patescibacteria group bacterium]